MQKNINIKEMNAKELKSLVRDVLRDYGHKTEKVAVECNGKLDYYTEREIRALQLIAKWIADESEEAFEDFCKSVTIYKGRTKGHKRDKSDRIVHLCKDGYLDNEFEPGFYEINTKLSRELM